LTPFTVTPPAPTLSSVSPSSALQGSTTNITLTGTNFISGTTAISVSGTGVLVTAANIVNATTITATLAVLAGPSVRGITVANGVTTSSAVNFTINQGTIGSATQFDVTTVAGQAGASATQNGTGSAARFRGSNLMGGDGSGNLFVIDIVDSVLRKMETAGAVVSTVSGTGLTLSSPAGVWSDGSNAYLTDLGNQRILRIEISTSVVSVVATGFSAPVGIWGDGINLYVTDSGDGAVKKVTKSGTVTTLASSFVSPEGITGDGVYLYVADSGASVIKRVKISDGSVTALAGSAGSPGHVDDTGSAARFSQPSGIWTDGSVLLITDSDKNVVRKLVLASNAVTTVAGLAANNGTDNGIGTSARFKTPRGIWSDGTNVFVADAGNFTIRKLTPAP
jgi:hypothetical protein